MDNNTILAIIGGSLSVVVTIGVGIWKAGRWHGEMVTKVDAVLGKISDQAKDIDQNRRAISKVHERVDDIYARQGAS